MQHILMRLKLKAGALPRFQEYLAEFETRRAECVESLEGEGTKAEAFFMVDGDVYVYKQVFDLVETRKYQKASGLKIYETVAGMMRDCIERTEEFSSILGFD